MRQLDFERLHFERCHLRNTLRFRLGLTESQRSGGEQ